MKITYLGQVGLMFETDGKTILVDPYLSDNVATVEPQNYRRVPVNESFFDVKPDVVVVTHNHLDHLDKLTLDHYLKEDRGILVLSPNGCRQELAKTYGGIRNNYVLFDPGTSWTEGETSFFAVKAQHSDPYAIGFILSAEGKNYYITGDTLYSESVFASLPDVPLYALFLPVNGKGNNMNMRDGERFSARVGAKYTVPYHIGMFDTLSATDFHSPNKITPKIWEEIEFE